MQRRKIIQNLLAIAAVSLTATFAHADDKQLKIGTMSGPDAQIWSVVTKVAAREGLNVKVIEFNDYVQPNAALDSGDLDHLSPHRLGHPDPSAAVLRPPLRQAIADLRKSISSAHA